MKSLWVTVGVVVGLGVAGAVAASVGGDQPNKIIGGEVPDSTTTDVIGTTSTSTSTTTGGVLVPVANLPTVPATLPATPPPVPSTVTVTVPPTVLPTVVDETTTTWSDPD